MNDQISWDSFLIKKFGSSNHYKLLNQLRNEVKKYPLKKKNLNSNISNINNNYKPDNEKNVKLFSATKNDDDSSELAKNNSRTLYKSSHDNYNEENSNNIELNNDYLNHNKVSSPVDLTETNSSYVNFNNTKDFNIHNNFDKFQSNDTDLNKKNYIIKNTLEKSENPLTFKERLNQIEMK